MSDWNSTKWISEDGLQEITIEQVLSDHKDVLIKDLRISDLTDLLTVQCDPLRIQRANIEFPILVLQQDDKFVCVLDGHHRIHKALSLGMEIMPAKVIKNYAPLYKVFS